MAANDLVLGAATSLAWIEQKMELDPVAWQPAFLAAKLCLERAALNAVSAKAKDAELRDHGGLVTMSDLLRVIDTG